MISKDFSSFYSTRHPIHHFIRNVSRAVRTVAMATEQDYRVSRRSQDKDNELAKADKFSKLEWGREVRERVRSRWGSKMRPSKISPARNGGFATKSRQEDPTRQYRSFPLSIYIPCQWLGDFSQCRQVDFVGYSLRIFIESRSIIKSQVKKWECQGTIGVSNIFIVAMQR